jgi:hypothetical protein
VVNDGGVLGPLPVPPEHVVNDGGVLGPLPVPPERVVNDGGVPAGRPAAAGRVVNVEIGELILDGFGPLDSRAAKSRPVDPARRDAARPNPGRLDAGRRHSRGPDTARAAEAFRRALARELGDAVPDAEQLAAAIAAAVFRQLAAGRQRRFPPRVRHRIGAELSAGTASPRDGAR